MITLTLKLKTDEERFCTISLKTTFGRRVSEKERDLRGKIVAAVKAVMTIEMKANGNGIFASGPEEIRNNIVKQFQKERRARKPGTKNQ